MQLRRARLCLDCEEVHDQFQCPVCASEQFTYLTRWVPAPERRSRPRQAPEAEDVQIYRRLVSHADRPSRGKTFVTRALLGLTAASVIGIFWGGRQARAAGSVAGEDPDEGD
jgi:hypothetical protein